MHKQYQFVLLGELAELHMGATPSRIEPSYWADGQSGEPWVAIRDIQGKFITRTSETITSNGIRAARMRRVEPGTPIMSFKLSLGRASIPTVPIYTNEAIVALKAKPGRSHARWLYHAVPFIAKSAVVETAIKGKTLNLEKLRKLRIPTPETLAAQCRIAEILDAVDKQIGATRRVLRKSGIVEAEVVPTLLRTMEWRSIPLAQCVRSDVPITYGIVQAGPHVDDGVPYIWTGDMSGAELSKDALMRTSSEIAASYTRSRVIAGDLVFSIRTTVGKVLPVPHELEGANLTQGTARVAPSERLAPRYLLWTLRSQMVRSQLSAMTKGTTFPEITLEQLRHVLVPVAHSHADQEAIVRVAEAAAEHVSAERSFIAKLHTLKQALMDDLLTGRVQVPVGAEG